jgi:hypothetical protein
MLDVKFPSILSEAVAPGSVNESPTSMFIVELPNKVIIGAFVSTTPPVIFTV